MFSVLDISTSGMRAQRARMETIANNIANQDVVGDTKGFHLPYRRREVWLQEAEPSGDRRFAGVQVVEITADPAPFDRISRPGHPFADENAEILSPNVDPVLEMVDMIDAQRAYEANAMIFENAKQGVVSTLRLLA